MRKEETGMHGDAALRTYLLLAIDNQFSRFMRLKSSEL
jgi:hypothetical protein